MDTPLLRRRFRSGGILLGLGAAVLAACSTMFAVRISEIKNAPSNFDGKDVTIEGKVTASHNLMVVKYYEVDDGSGAIPVVTESALPKEGDTVRVKGRVNQAFVLGTARLVVIVEQPIQR